MTLKEKCAILEQRVERLQEIGLALSTEDNINVPLIEFLKKYDSKILLFFLIFVIFLNL